MFKKNEIHLYGDFGQAVAVQAVRAFGPKMYPRELQYSDNMRVVVGGTRYHLHPRDAFDAASDPAHHVRLDHDLGGKIVRLQADGGVGIHDSAMDRDAPALVVAH